MSSLLAAYWPYIRVLAFSLSVLPAAIYNFHTYRIRNAHAVIIAGMGLLVLFIGHSQGLSRLPFMISGFGMILSALLISALVAIRVFPGGSAKIMIAIAAWFSFLNFLGLVAVYVLFSFRMVALRKDRGHPYIAYFCLASLAWLVNFELWKG